MTLNDTISILEDSEEFKRFNNENPHHYLVHIFTTAVVSETLKIEPVEAGYYGEDTDMITVFKTSPVKMVPAEKVFKEDGKLERLDIEKVTLGVEECMILAKGFHEKKNPRHPCMRMITILQQKDTPVWNVTIVTHTLQMSNIKINAVTSEIISDEMTSLLNLSKD